MNDVTGLVEVSFLGLTEATLSPQHSAEVKLGPQVIRMWDVLEIHGQQLLRGIAKNAAHCRIDANPITIQSDKRHSHPRLIEGAVYALALRASAG
jgi:hypothetical protein